MFDRIPALVFSLLLVAVGAWAETPSQKIDRFVASELARQDLEPNAPIDDHVFLRRAFLNIGGRIPTIEEAEAIW